MVEPPTLVVDKEEQLVLDDRAAEGGTEHIPAQCRRRVASRGSGYERAVFPLIGVEDIVTDELKHIPVGAVGTRLNGGVDDSASVVAKLRRSILCNQIELPDRSRRGRVTARVVRCLVVIDAVEQEIIVFLAVSVDIRTATSIHGALSGLGSVVERRGIR